jgi:RyR domain-containing protein
VTYEPDPVDTSGVALPAEIVAITEHLARNVHAVWARQRLRDGWVWGPRRDDAAKQHPSLVEYDALGDEEREYDRQTALETLRTLVALGYRIEKR